MTADWIVVGGGHNGLTCGAYLSKAGEDVLVLERRDVLGGCGTSEPIIPEFPGFTFNPGAFDLLGIREQPFFQDLELEKNGLELLTVEPMFLMPFPDGHRIFFWRDLHRTAEEIAAISPRDAERYVTWVEFWAQAFEMLDPINTGAPPSFAAMASLMEDSPEVEELLRVMMMPARQYIYETFESTQMQGLGAFMALQTKSSLDQPGSALAMTELVMSHYGGVYRPRGGVGQISAAVARALESYGGRIQPEAAVAEILVQGGRARGVRLETGERIEARKGVVTAIAPQTVFLEMIVQEHLDHDFLHRVRHLQNDNTAVIKAYYALSAPPQFSSVGDDGSRPEFRIPAAMITPSVDYADAMWAEIRRREIPTHPWIWCTFSTGLDPSMAPPGQHALGLHCWVPYELADQRDWDDAKEEAAMRMFDTYCAYAPNLKDKLLGWAARTPKDWEQIVGIPKGNNFHIDMVPHQVFGFRPLPELSNYRTPIGGLYLTGAGTHPGPAITGLPGHNTAQEILRDLGKVKDD